MSIQVKYSFVFETIIIAFHNAAAHPCIMCMHMIIIETQQTADSAILSLLHIVVSVLSFRKECLPVCPTLPSTGLYRVLCLVVLCLVAMGNCVGGANVHENVFKVININDNKNLVQRGLMEVTNIELIYVDSRTKEEWHWPLKYLRKYGCDGDVFTFEAGRKCPGGEGLYAFSTKKASLLFEMVARNINQGNLQPSGELSPFSESQAPDSNMLNFPPRRQSTTSPTSPHPPITTQDQPSYTNLDLMGNPLENGELAPANDVTPEPKKFVYREVIFDKPPEEHPKPPSTPQQNPSYTQIDFDQTERFNQERKSGGGALPAGSTAHERSSSTTSTTVSGSISPTKRERTRRTRVHTYSGRERHISHQSESSFSSQSSLTESSRDVRKHNGGIPQAGISDPNDPTSFNYQNVSVGVIPEQQYQNVQVGAGEVSQVFESPSPQPNYCNVSLTASGGGTTPVSRMEQLVVNGDSMTTYAQLELSRDGGRRQRRTMSSSSASRDAAKQPSYMQLEFQRGEESPSAVPLPNEGGVHQHGSRRSASVSGTAAPASGRAHHMSGHVLTGQNIPEESSPQLPHEREVHMVDESRVTYGVLDFRTTEALSKLSAQREQEREQREQKEKEEKEQKEKEKANPHKKKQK